MRKRCGAYQPTDEAETASRGAAVTASAAYASGSQIACPRQDYLFPALHTTQRPLSDNTLNVALRRLGFDHDEMTSHGFRAMASTLLNESGLWHPDAIERPLAHGEKDRVRAAYHRGAHWAERVRMAQWWSDYLDQLRVGGKVIKRKFRSRA